MPIQNKIQIRPLSSIHIPRESRQRTELNQNHVISLAQTIAENQWISPVLIDQDSLTLIAGEHRMAAVELLHSVIKQFAPLEVADLFLIPPKCNVPAWQDWTCIPTQAGTKLTDADIMVFEFVENNSRAPLEWYDLAQAIYDIHALKVTSEPKWHAAATARLLGMNTTLVSRALAFVRMVAQEPEDFQKEIRQASSLTSAVAVLDRVRARKEGPVTLGKPRALPPQESAKPEASPQEPLQVGEISSPDDLPPEEPSILLNLDFHEFAAHWRDQPFNFIHCDFPYGIKYNDGPGMHTSLDLKKLGAYDDDPDVYWKLIETLVKYRAFLIAPSCHIMFWLSQNLRDATLEVFRTAFPDAIIQPFLMIWHCSDNSGIVPDPNRYGRRTYETAMLLTFGDRPVHKPVALSYASPRNVDRIHRSQKPLPVLEHFLKMFVDSSTKMLDPTAGSGSALVAAQRLGAQSVLGLELDPEMCSTAQTFIQANTK